MKTSQVVSSLLSLIAMTCVTAAQTLQFIPSAPAPAITHSFSHGAVTDIQAFHYTNSDVHLSDYNTIQLTVSAPPGQAWRLNCPSPAPEDPPQLGLNLLCVTPGQGSGGPRAQIISASLDFNYVLGGPALVSAPGFFNDISSNTLSIAGTVWVNGSLAFTSVTLTVCFDNSLLAAAPLVPVWMSELIYSYGGLSLDPGPQLSLIPVPAPTPLFWQTVRFPGANEVLVFSWTNSSLLLQAAPTAMGVFTNIPGATSPYAVSTKASQLFFRLQAN